MTLTRRLCRPSRQRDQSLHLRPSEQACGVSNHAAAAAAGAAATDTTPDLDLEAQRDQQKVLLNEKIERARSRKIEQEQMEEAAK